MREQKSAEQQRKLAGRGAAPVPSAEIRITCVDAAHTSSVDNACHQDDRPQSWVSAPMPIKDAHQHQENTDVIAERTPPKQAAADDGIGTAAGLSAGMAAPACGVCKLQRPARGPAFGIRF